MSPHAPVTRIGPATGWTPLDFRELWEHREVFYLLVWRDVKLRYRHRRVGALWALLQPLLSMLMLSLFGRIVGVKSGGIPYPLFAASGLVPWTYFTHALTQASNSLVHSEVLLTKIYFPRIMLPMAAVVSGAADFLVASLLLPFLMLYYRIPPSTHLLALPLLLVLTMVIALAVGLWLAALNIEFRDLTNALPFLVQLLFFLTPVAYPASMIPLPWRMYAGVNPLTGMVEAFRWALFGEASPGLLSDLGLSLASVALLLATGVLFFQWKEETFAEIV
jgi:lipopolysaccharide transport system permease protein